jgi:hypothetical protein
MGVAVGGGDVAVGGKAVGVLVAVGVSVGLLVGVAVAVFVGGTVGVSLGASVSVGGVVGVSVGVSVLVGIAAGVVVGCALCVASIAACTVASILGVGAPPQAASNKLDSTRTIERCFIVSRLLVTRTNPFSPGLFSTRFILPAYAIFIG